jgi:hypothetical protein
MLHDTRHFGLDVSLANIHEPGVAGLDTDRLTRKLDRFEDHVSLTSERRCLSRTTSAAMSPGPSMVPTHCTGRKNSLAGARHAAGRP